MENAFFRLDFCGETIILGLSNVLSCLKFAEECGEVPKLPQAWWEDIARREEDEAFQVKAGIDKSISN